MKQQAATNIKKSISHLNKVSNMIDNEEYCINIIQQIQAVQGYLKSAQQKLLEGHLQHCYKEALAKKDPKEEQRVLNELLRVFSKSA